MHQPWSCNTVINCGGVVVRPGDAIVGDDDGAVVIPAAVAREVYDIAHSREIVEDIVKQELTENPGPPGKFYPFMSGKIKPRVAAVEAHRVQGARPQEVQAHRRAPRRARGRGGARRAPRVWPRRPRCAPLHL